MGKIIKLLEEYNMNHGTYMSCLRIYDDMSGTLSYEGRTLFEFNSEEELIEKLKQ